MTTTTKKRLTPAQKRVLIAKDALKQIETKVIRACSGVYCSSTQESYDIIENSVNKNSNIQLKKLLPRVQKNCKVCALGSLFLSHVRKFNNFLARDYLGIGIYDICELLTYFDSNNINLIEAAFEGWCFGDVKLIMRKGKLVWRRVGHYTGNIMSGCEYKETYPSDKKRLTIILQNIIRNKGTFIPELNNKGKPY